ncbi:hypothetical protein M408DRAFT_10037 [Serendipita vermifera MAFF 305830]|uniref:F-box domain-containing protein n=1 Tax=Serendipita vermifera MAFF 305830 TaxID=933852 RepID=A0A0C2WIK8_SERVB|nr:hypothetical protein M408DRAFT_10037 [Serendipita vermifera MAFF 305830]
MAQMDSIIDGGATLRIQGGQNRYDPLEVLPQEIWTNIVVETALEDDLSREIVPLYRKLSPMPLLEHIICGPYWNINPKIAAFLGSIPTPLREIGNIKFSNEGLFRRINISRLRSIHLDTSPGPFVDEVVNAPCLEEVVVHSHIKSQSLDIPEPSQIHSKPLGWKRLRWISGEMKCLTHLLLRLGSTCSNFRAPTNPHVSTTINTIELTFSYYSSQADQDIAHLLFLCCPNTTQLSLFPSDRSSIRVYTSVSGFRKLEVIHIGPGWWEDEDVNEQKMTISDAPASFADSVKSLSYFASLDELKLLFPQRVSKVKHLTLDIIDDGELVLDPLRWPDMETLTVSGRLEMVWGTGIFRYLVSISIYNSVQVLNWKDPWALKNVTKICRDIALYSDRFPSLRKLRLEVCPEWDILLILLVRRNIRSTPGISAITTLDISTRCPPLLIECFKSIIQGAPVAIPTYYELSLAGTLEIARDLSIPGCYCEVIDDRRIARYRRKGRRPPQQHIEYPEDESEILQTWEARADQWYPFERAPRADTCKTRFEMVTLSRWEI